MLERLGSKEEYLKENPNGNYGQALEDYRQRLALEHGVTLDELHMLSDTALTEVVIVETTDDLVSH